MFTVFSAGSLYCVLTCYMAASWSLMLFQMCKRIWVLVLNVELMLGFCMEFGDGSQSF